MSASNKQELLEKQIDSKVNQDLFYQANDENDAENDYEETNSQGTENKKKKKKKRNKKAKKNEQGMSEIDSQSDILQNQSINLEGNIIPDLDNDVNHAETLQSSSHKT